MIVADSSFIAEGLLKRKNLLEENEILTPALALYEVTNSIWKHQYILKDLEDGLPYVSILYGLVDSGAIRIVQPDEELLTRSYAMAARNRVSIYDAIFVSLALEIGLELKTFDRQQTRIMRLEAKQR
ncbi:MAG: type II toxin-antitoxin system VapC family toxin [Thaumarchaeota archaeon]|nr:type II toxin-antitoxin system VapC family toxin [Nitrososphaerota archaeon]